MNFGPFYATWAIPNQLPAQPFRYREAMQALRAAGGSGWDQIVDPEFAPRFPVVDLVNGVGYYGDRDASTSQEPSDPPA